MKKFISLILASLSLIICFGCKSPSAPAETLGVWWWDKSLNAEAYLDFAESNSVTGIYYCDSSFDESTESFITKANDRNIEVFFLAGEYQWLRDSSKLYSLIQKYTQFQTNNPENNFAGIHLDIEPHQDPQFSSERKLLLESLVSLTYNLKADFPDICFAYDIPFWIDDEITFNGEALPAYAHVIKYADRTFIMSYRDTAEGIYDVAKEEIEFAKSVNKTLVLGVETYSEEGNGVSFMEEGKEFMYGEIEKLRTLIPENFGVSVHQIKSWYDLKD